MRLRRNHNQVQTIVGSVTIRRLGDDDAAALERLAERDSNRSLELEHGILGAEVEGSLLAAISLDTGEVVADPFSRTNELRAMLELRAKQLRRRVEARPRSARSATLASSPPGAGGRLLSLLPRA